MSHLRLALCQLDTVVGEVDGNAERIIDRLARSEAEGHAWRRADLKLYWLGFGGRWTPGCPDRDGGAPSPAVADPMRPEPLLGPADPDGGAEELALALRRGPVCAAAGRQYT